MTEVKGAESTEKVNSNLDKSFVSVLDSIRLGMKYAGEKHEN